MPAAEETGDVAAGRLQRSTQVPLEQRAEDGADDERQHRQSEPPHREPEQAERQQQEQVEGLALHGVRTHRGEEEDPRVEVGARDAQELGPGRRERQVEHEEEGVADEQARDEHPDEVGLLGEQEWPGLDAIAHERRDDDRGGRVRGQPQRQQGHHRPRSRGVVRGLGTGHTLDGALPELLGVLGELALGEVGQEGRDLGPSGRDGPEREAERRPPEPGLPRPPPVRPGQPWATHGDDGGGLAAQVGRHPEGLADGEDADGDDDDVDVVGQERAAEGEPLLARDEVGAHQPQGDAHQQGGEATHPGGAEDRGRADEGDEDDREELR